jgi:hypothetical protein
LFLLALDFSKLGIELVLQADEDWGRGRNPLENTKKSPKEEDSTARAKWLVEQLRFRMKEAMAQRGGSEAFLHFLRSEGGKSA